MFDTRHGQISVNRNTDNFDTSDRDEGQHVIQADNAPIYLSFQVLKVLDNILSESSTAKKIKDGRNIQL